MLVLTDEEKVAIELYLKQINQTNEEQRQKRIILYTTIIGVFIAAFAGILIGILSWALNSITSGAHDAGIVAATLEVPRLLQSPPILKMINDQIERASNAALKATESADGAKAAASVAKASADGAKATVEGANAAASEAAVSLNALRKTIDNAKVVANAINNIQTFVDQIAENQTFQNAVLTKINLVPERIGPNGIEGQVPDPGIFSGVNFRIVPQAEGAPVCTISDIGITSSAGNCALHRDGNGWSISAMGGMQCRITCFRLTTK